jgi:hypothetical protein
MTDFAFDKENSLPSICAFNKEIVLEWLANAKVSAT